MDPSISVEPASTTTLHELEPIQSTEEEKLNTLIISLTPDGNRITYECTIDETIKSLKERMSNDQGEGKLRLLYRGKILEDSSNLASVGIEPETSTIFHLSVQSIPTLEERSIKETSNSCCIIG